MPIRSANAVWEGDLAHGHGTMRTATASFEGPYTFASRFQEGKGVNPEELIGAAHAGCFSMALSHGLAQGGHTPRRVSTTAKVHLDKGDAGFRITTIELNCEADVPGISGEEFQKAAEDARVNCPVAQALKGVEIKLQAVLK
jgi:osmotically inducible protein OsmC